jgi:hypothetical protein
MPVQSGDRLQPYKTLTREPAFSTPPNVKKSEVVAALFV